MKVSDITDRALNLLLDTDERFWTAEEMLPWVNEAQMEIYKLKPDVSTSTINFSLSGGVRQNMPDEADYLVAAASSTGISPTMIDKRDLDWSIPDWAGHDESSTPQHIMYEERNPEIFWVYPPATNGAEIVLSYAAPPIELTSNEQAIVIGDQYAGSLLSYVLYRAHTKDTKEASPARAQSHYQDFLRQMGRLDEREKTEAGGEPEQEGLR